MDFSLKEYFRRCRCRMDAQWKSKPFEEYKIHCDDKEYLRIERRNIHGEHGLRILPWNKINLVWVYKRDLFVIDLICMWVVTSKTAGLEINEDMEGWDKLLKILPERLPGINNEWWSDVAFPTFETNSSMVYRNADADQAELNEIIKDFEAGNEIPRPKPFWDFLYLLLILLTFPWPFVGLTILCIPQIYLGILLVINLSAFVLLLTRILVHWELYFPLKWTCRILQVIAIVALISYYITPFIFEYSRI